MLVSVFGRSLGSLLTCMFERRGAVVEEGDGDDASLLMEDVAK